MKINNSVLKTSLILALVLLALAIHAQAPQKVSYQMVVREASGELVKEANVGLRISLLQGSAEGSAVYVETHTKVSNVNGLVSLEVGSGTPVENSFAAIDWSTGPYFLKAETDPDGGSTYTISGTSEILSVPYALHAKTAETLTGSLLARIEALEFVNSQELLELQELLDNGFTDSRDGTHYDAVKIGNQIWMAENLAYLPSVNQVADGSEDVAGSYYYVYGYDGTVVADAKATANYTTYGVLYNWTAAMNGEASSAANPSGVQGVCPTGWHLPSDAEWTTLEDYLIANGYNYDGTTTGNKIAKSLATATGWFSSTNVGAVGNSDYTEKQNSTSFSALPGGGRLEYGCFGNVGSNGGLWSATMNGSSIAFYRFLNYNNSGVNRVANNLEYGFSVRCVRD
ncbi:MAG: hypothetical protein JW798_07430 [Prolixibacteraceae bacterium]|nr:hypothetical protein [Prolixibacteraceae bacterium]